MAWHTDLCMADTERHLTVRGDLAGEYVDLAGEYVVDEELPDGRLVIRADTSAAAMHRRQGLEPLSAETFDEFLAEHGDQLLPPDDEG
jgi:hypothetical protein